MMNIMPDAFKAVTLLTGPAAGAIFKKDRNSPDKIWLMRWKDSGRCGIIYRSKKNSRGENRHKVQGAEERLHTGFPLSIECRFVYLFDSKRSVPVK